MRSARRPSGSSHHSTVSHETTANLLDNAIVNLLSHPDQLALVRKGEVPWADVVEENLRHQAPIANILMRFATEDIDDAETGLSFAKGEAFVINYAAIGRTPRPESESAADPAVFDITRPVKEHLSFGHGVHFCMGSELARMESRIALSMMFERFPDLALTVPFEDLRPMESFISNGHRTLPAALHPGEPVSIASDINRAPAAFRPVGPRPARPHPLPDSAPGTRARVDGPGTGPGRALALLATCSRQNASGPARRPA